LNRNTFRSLLGLWIGGAHNEAKKLSDGVYAYTQILTIPQNTIALISKQEFSSNVIGLNFVQEYPSQVNTASQSIYIANNIITRDSMNTIADSIIQVSQVPSIPEHAIVCN
jgi:hypothetical protein